MEKKLSEATKPNTHNLSGTETSSPNVSESVNQSGTIVATGSTLELLSDSNENIFAESALSAHRAKMSTLTPQELEKVQSAFVKLANDARGDNEC